MFEAGRLRVGRRLREGRRDVPPPIGDRAVLAFFHDPHYAIVQVQAVVPQITEPGRPPPTPEADADQPVVSVLMVRDLGTSAACGAGHDRHRSAIFLVLVLRCSTGGTRIVARNLRRHGDSPRADLTVGQYLPSS